MAVQKLVWYICIKHGEVVFYIAEVDLGASTVKWTKDRSIGIPFNTESGVHKFIASFLPNRRDIFLIQSPSED